MLYMSSVKKVDSTIRQKTFSMKSPNPNPVHKSQICIETIYKVWKQVSLELSQHLYIKYHINNGSYLQECPVDGVCID